MKTIKTELVNYYDTWIEVQENGEIRDKGVVRKHRLNADGYPVVSINTPYGWRSVAVHILIAIAFVKNNDPLNKTEVNHKDFNRTNWSAENLEWVSHKENIEYSVKAGRYVGKFGKDNPNYGNDTLRKKYKFDKNLAKEKQSRPRGQNGRAVNCYLKCIEVPQPSIPFNCQREAVEWLINMQYVPAYNKEYLIKRLKTIDGYCGWKLIKQ